MPATHTTDYKRPWWLSSGHAETIFPALYRKVRDLPVPGRERIGTPDGDFLDLDWWKTGNDRLLVLQHGLEGSSDRPYILGMVKVFMNHGFDVLAWNFRGCSGEMNRSARFYHSGATDDLESVVDHAAPAYHEICLAGFSLGGNLTLKYLGEQSRNPKIKRAVVISTPLDLDAGADNLHTVRGYLYEKRFLRSLKKKILEKAQLMPKAIDVTLFARIRSLRDFDELYTAPLHGFQSAADYYARCSSKFFLEGIQVPTLILNAVNDPVLTAESLDHTLTAHLNRVHLETTRHGGHVGFTSFTGQGTFWSEQRALQFCLEN